MQFIRYLFSALLFAWAGLASAQVTVDSIVDPETFPVPTTVSDANVRLLSKYSTTWYMVKPSQLRLDVDPTWGVISTDSTGNVTWLGTAKPSSDGNYIAITDFEGDRIFLPTLAKADSAIVTVNVSNDTLFYTNNAGVVGFEVLPTSSGGGEINQGQNLGAGSEVFKAMSDSTLLFRTLDVSGTLINITQTDTTLVFEVIEDDNQTIDSLALNGSILTVSLEDDGEAPLTLDLAPLTGAGTDNQTVDTLSFSGGIITLALRDDGEAPYTVDISGVDTDTQLSEEQVEDFVGNMFSGNTETLITVTYQDSDGTIDLVVNDDLSLYDNTTSDFATNSALQDTAAAIRGDFPAPAGIPLRYNYDALRTNPPADSIVFITNPTYEGLFRRVLTGTENSGTVILDDSSDYWQRLHDPAYYNVNWFEIGGDIENTQIGNVINSYSDVLNAIMDESGGGCTVDFAGPDSPKAFELDKRIDLAPYVTFIGQGDTLRRHTTPWTTITAAGVAADGDITVADTTGFRIGQRVTVTTYRSHTGVLVSKKKITDIPNATTLDLEGTIGGDVSIGDTVFVSFSMFINGDALELGNINFEGIVFDGNAADNPYTVSWSQQTTMNISNNSGSHLSINNCYFHDTPTENLIAATATITNSEANNLGGSLYHISGIPDTAFQVHIENVWAYNTNTATTDSTDHSEALIVSSASPANVKIYNCQFFNGEEPIIGDFGGSTDWWEIRNTHAENFDGISFGSVSASQSIEGLRIQDNHFINCNSLDFTGGDLLNGEVLIDPIITGNTFINTTVRIEGSRNMRFADNSMLYEPSEGGFTNFIEDGLPYEDAMCYFSEFAHLDFENNVLRSDTVVMTDTLVYGVIFDNTGAFDNTITTQFYLGYGLNCSGNTIEFFQKGITCDTAVVAPLGGDNRRTRVYHNWKIENNVVSMLQSSDANAWGILVGPGVQVLRNTVYTSQDTTVTTHYPIFAYGIDDQGSSNLDLPGATVMYNDVIGPWNFAQSIHSIFIGGNTSSDQGGFNCIVKYNLTPTPISGGGATQSPSISRILYNDLISDEIPDMTTPAFPPDLNFEY